MPHPALLAFCLPALLLCNAVAAAQRPAPMPDVPVWLELVERDTGLPLPAAYQYGRQWVAGRPGQRYAVRLHNRSHERLLVVLSVDGINAISGQTADPGQTGYVLDPGQTADIDGWRKSLQAVAGFVFVDPGASYAVRTGRARHVGVVGIAVHRERAPASAPPLAHRSIKGDDAAAAAPAETASAQAGRIDAAQTRQRIGTGHGRIEASWTWQTRFERDPRPLQLTELRYDTPAALRARGIGLSVAPTTYHTDAPRAFPNDGFVPDPPR